MNEGSTEVKTIDENRVVKETQGKKKKVCVHRCPVREEGEKTWSGEERIQNLLECPMRGCTAKSQNTGGAEMPKDRGTLRRSELMHRREKTLQLRGLQKFLAGGQN